MSRIDLLEWAWRFIATPSVSRDGNRAIAEAAAELARRAGLAVRVAATRVGAVEHFTVLADLGPAAAPDGLLLVTHLDTVPPGDPALWTRTGGDPFRPVRDGELLYGLGSADAKVDFVCKAAALAELDPSRLARPVRLAGTFGEEIGLLGARELVRSGATEGFRFAMVGEPSELSCIHAHKGYAVYQARIALARSLEPGGGRLERHTALGRAAHSSAPALGENAIERALERIAAPDVLGLVALEGGDAVNVVPERCSLELLVRGVGPAGARLPVVHDARPLLSFALAWQRLRQALAEHKDAGFDPDHTVASLGRVRMEDGSVLLDFDLRPVPGSDPHPALLELAPFAVLECVRENPPLRMPLASRLVRAVAAAQERTGLGVRVGTKATCTEAGIFAQAGLDACVLGPGPSVGNVHRPNEHTRIPELAQARDLYRETVLRLCGKG
jgi:succinyl-diaminopimelate desuccinylase